MKVCEHVSVDSDQGLMKCPQLRWSHGDYFSLYRSSHSYVRVLPLYVHVVRWGAGSLHIPGWKPINMSQAVEG